MGGAFESRVDYNALTEAASRPGSATRYKTLLNILEKVVVNHHEYRGAERIRRHAHLRTPSASSDVILLASKQKSHLIGMLPWHLLCQILDLAFRNDVSRFHDDLMPDLTPHRQSCVAHPFYSCKDASAAEKIPLQLPLQQADVGIFIASSAKEQREDKVLRPKWVFYLPKQLSDVSMKHFDDLQRFLAIGSDGSDGSDVMAMSIVHTFEYAFPNVFTAKYDIVLETGYKDYYKSFGFIAPNKAWLAKFAYTLQDLDVHQLSNDLASTSIR